ncbi:hypothetical protein HDV64DRAFT_257539 [Trichoderma sp. TUCIM 5745]
MDQHQQQQQPRMFCLLAGLTLWPARFWAPAHPARECRLPAVGAGLMRLAKDIRSFISLVPVSMPIARLYRSPPQTHHGQHWVWCLLLGFKIEPSWTYQWSVVVSHSRTTRFDIISVWVAKVLHGQTLYLHYVDALRPL